MQNVTMSVSRDKTKLTIEVDLTQEQGNSKSGKSVNIASTGGSIKVDGFNDVYIGLNVYRKKAAGKSESVE